MKLVLSFVFVVGILFEVSLAAASNCTKPNEVYEECPTRCPFRTCGIDDTLIDCIPEQKCLPPGCRCKPQFFRDDKGNCVPWEECPTCPNPNEEYDPCFSPCGMDRCDFDPTVVRCIMAPQLGDPGCVAGCRCKDGFLRNSEGVCVTREECPCGGDPNAQPGCGGFCTRCSNYKKGPVACAAACQLGGCDCKKGYIYDDVTMKCVLPKDCTLICPLHEVVDDCSNTYCAARKCSELGKPVPWCTLTSGDCVKACVCESGYLRADNGTCIPSNSCPACNDDPNARPGCGVFCTHCGNYKKGPVACPAICMLNGCECKESFIYDRNIKKCVRPEQCTPTCQINEEYSTCANLACRLKNCSQYGQPMPFCPKIDTSKCKAGCLCKSKYLRNDKGICVPEKECRQAKQATAEGTAVA